MKQIAGMTWKRYVVFQLGMLGTIFCTALPEYLGLPLVFCCTLLVADLVRDPSSWTQELPRVPRV